MTRPVILVTGAGGFIGGWMAEALHLSGAAQIRAGVSRWTGAARIARFPLEVVQCDVMDPDSLDRALAGIDVVVHCARARGNDNSVTTAGTRLLLERATAAGVRQLVFTSSVATYGDPTGVVHEDTPPTPGITPYGQGKRDAEALCRQFASPALRVAVLRPTLVYGPFGEQWSMPWLARFASGRWRALGPLGEGKCNLVYVGDLVRFVQFLITADLPPFTVFNANGPEVPTWNSYLERFNAALGYPPLRPPAATLRLQVAARRPVRAAGKLLLARCPGLLHALAGHSAKLRTLMQRTEEDLRLAPGKDDMHRFATNVTYAMDAAARAGFRPSTPVDEGIRLTVDWARHLGLVPSCLSLPCPSLPCPSLP